MTLEESVRKRLKEVRELIARGKGTWPNPDYVQDHVWDAWNGERHVLRMVLIDAGLKDPEGD
jgi:hypothetical protein